METTLIALIVILTIYFTPAIIAYSRKKRNVNAILVLNIFLGWTIIGWLIALIWAFTIDS